MSPIDELNSQRRHARSQALAQAVVAAFTERLREETARHGGSLGSSQIEALNAEFVAKADQLTELFDKAFDEAALEQEKAHWHAIKRPAFDRLMVKRIEHLLIHEEADAVKHTGVSRRFLPGFFLAVNMMMGAETLEQYHWRSDAAVDRIMDGRLPVDWNLIDADAEVHDIIVDAQYAIALHFEKTDFLFKWFINIVNTHLAPVADPAAPDAEWELDPNVLRELINALLTDLKQVMADDAAWNRLIQRHADADREKLRAIFERLK